MHSARSKRSILVLTAVLLVLPSQPVSAKTFSRCALVGELLKLNFSKTYLASFFVVSCLLDIFGRQETPNRLLHKKLSPMKNGEIGVYQWICDTWDTRVCLVESESKANTKSISHGYTTRYGLFQIDNRQYCMEAKKGGTCNLACSSLVDDDLVEDARCAKLIYEREGFKYWPNWVKQCKGKPLPVVNKCNEYTSTLTKLRNRRSIASLWQSLKFK